MSSNEFALLACLTIIMKYECQNCECRNVEVVIGIQSNPLSSDEVELVHISWQPAFAQGVPSSSPRDLLWPLLSLSAAVPSSSAFTIFQNTPFNV